MWQPQPLAALITAIASLIVALVTGLYFNIKLEHVKLTTAKRLQEHAVELAEASTYRTARRDRLAVLLNTASMARSASGELLGTAEVGPDRHHELFKRTSTAFQQLSTFFAEVTNAETNKFLTSKDVEKINNFQLEIMRMFFALDLDSGGNQDYKRKLLQCHTAIESAFEQFKAHFLEIQDQIMKHAGQN